MNAKSRAISLLPLISLFLGSVAFATNETECLKLNPWNNSTIRSYLTACDAWSRTDAEWNGAAINAKLGLGLFGNVDLTNLIQSAARECEDGLGRGCPAAVHKLYVALAPLRRAAQADTSKQGEFVDMPAICDIKPIPRAKFEEYLRDPVYGPVAKAFVVQAKNLKNDRSIFGENFVPYEPDSKAGYSKEYAVDPEDTGLISDRTQRPLIRNELRLTDNADPFEKLYSLSSEWHPQLAQRRSGYTFTGFKTSPEQYEKRCGLWGELFTAERAEPNIRRFENLFEEKMGRKKLERNNSEPVFSIPLYINNTTNSIFRSTTRSVWVARKFATSPGAKDLTAKEAWVYVVLVHHGFDFRDPAVVPNPGLIAGEQEITVGGMIPWSDIVGYRKILVEPSPGAPPEFTGPVYLREKLKALDPLAFAKILNTLSMKSKYTQDFEQNRQWRGNRD